MSNGVADSSSGRVAETKRHSFLVGFVIRLVREKPLGTAGGIITLLLLLTGIFADLIAPYGMNENVGYFLTPPSAKFWLGTDNIGRDLLSRIIFGARISVIVGLAVAILSTVMATFIGIVSGYIGGRFDLIVQRVVDTFLCLPGLLILLVVLSIVGPGLLQIIVLVGLLWGVTTSRIIRGAVMSVKEDVYVQAAVAIGCSNTRILTRHILPNVMASVIILFSTRVPQAILTEAALSFLGFGIPPPTPSWGGMLSGSGRQYMFMAPWLVIWPGLALAIVVYGVNVFGDAVRDLLDPRLRGGAGRYGVRVRKEATAKSEPSAPEG